MLAFWFSLTILYYLVVGEKREPLLKHLVEVDRHVVLELGQLVAEGVTLTDSVVSVSISRPALQQTCQLKQDELMVDLRPPTLS